MSFGCLYQNPYYIFDKCCDNIRLLDQPSTSSVSGSNLGRPRRDDELDGVVLSTAYNFIAKKNYKVWDFAISEIQVIRYIILPY